MCEWIESWNFDLIAVAGKPCCRIAEALRVREGLIAFDDVPAVFGNGIAEAVIASERRVLFSALSQAA
ncbi:hypothetical protein [Mesorhizobium sp. M2A.F.Ca.ET.029.05.1.1]|uniref:hypothetical protein n=1 Tax=Mesorhizobium sp. M2A.F.Ca.ET.029.05.1.1 TaxID=2496658 RepID=UPI001FE090BF|nr:hypothetical protein [Mesorhizobium sp. M2A.F.Ca.ET.029.05.1.1]